MSLCSWDWKKKNTQKPLFLLNINILCFHTTIHSTWIGDLWAGGKIFWQCNCSLSSSGSLTSWLHCCKTLHPPLFCFLFCLKFKIGYSLVLVACNNKESNVFVIWTLFSHMITGFLFYCTLFYIRFGMRFFIRWPAQNLLSTLFWCKFLFLLSYWVIMQTVIIYLSIKHS